MNVRQSGAIIRELRHCLPAADVMSMHKFPHVIAQLLLGRDADGVVGCGSTSGEHVHLRA